ncbi:MAG: ATP-dependent DNA helicase RecG [Patescibacteria group bacterium]
MNLSDAIELLPRTRSLTIDKFKLLEIRTFEDLLTYIPTRYEDYSIISTIGKLQEGEKVTVKGRIVSAKHVFTKSHVKIQKVVLEDETGKVEITWFNQPFLVRLLKDAAYLSVAGEVKRFLNTYTIQPAEYEVLKTLDQQHIHTGRLVPIYSEKKGLSTKTIREKMTYALQSLESNAAHLEWLPSEIREYNKLMDEVEAYKQIHFPASKEMAGKARARLAFDELFTIQLSNALIRKEWEEEQVGQKLEVEKYKEQIETFIKTLPFELTAAQQRVVDEVLGDFNKTTPMNRFVQGDVGSGKTVVAAIAAYVAYLNGFQTLYMAPTEILAQQHYATIANLFKNYPLKVGLQTGSQKVIKTDKKSVATTQIDGDPHVIIGTQALLNESLFLDKVGLVIIDEQHRFGVKQRSMLKQKGFNPHLITMTATPIPRTVALTLYGELDLSVIDEMPKGRLPIKTWVVSQSKRADAYEWIKKQMSAEKTQTFVICPLIEESEVETMKSVKAVKMEYELLKTTVFKDWSVGLLHGKLKPIEKADMMNKFKSKQFDVLVATSVVEVGIDVPNATIMIIEGAERYGLAQLHQLRGRVGRGDIQSYCILFSDSTESSNRLQYFAKTNSGMQLAEFDLKLRGSGDIYGLRQHGYSDLKIASFADIELINETKHASKYFMDHLSLNKFPKVKERVDKYGLKEVARD